MKISFVIPAYNVQNYVGKCLDSILRQPFDDYEIIVIDDGSTDGTPGILMQYQSRHPSIRILTQENSGQGAARSLGITEAQGEYIWFVDSDDWLLPSVLPRISRILGSHKPDVMLANYEYSFDNAPAQPSSAVPPHLAGQIVSPRADAATFACVSCWNTPPWRLISRRQHLLDHDIQFARGVFYEDHPFAIHLMLTAETVYVDGSVVYSYYQRSGSTTNVNDHKAFDFLTIRKQCLALLQHFGEYERFASIVVGYLAPANFYAAHVDKSLQAEFMARLRNDFSADEFAFVDAHGDHGSRLFAEAVKKNDPSVISRGHRTQRLRRLLSKATLNRIRKMIIGALTRRLVSYIHKLKVSFLRSTSHPGADPSGQRFLKAGIGTRIEPIYIDVRINQEHRPYVVIGEYSHVGGTFVFERGVGTIQIGDKSSIGGGCKLICTQSEGITIGNNVMLSWDCTVMDSNSHSLNPDVRANDAYDWKCGLDAGRIGAYKDWSQVESGRVVIGDNVWVGFETAIMKGVHIGRGSVVASRSIVTKNVAPFNIVGGSPARFIGFTPRDKWTWEEIVHAMQGDPTKQEMLMHSYLHLDLRAMLKQYRESEEFRDTAALVRQSTPIATSMLDVGSSNGVIGIAFAIEGFNVTLVEPSNDSLVGTEAATVLLEIAAREIDSTVINRVKIANAAIEEAQLQESYDFINCRQVAHHFVDPIVALKKIRSLLRPDGVLLLVREHVIFDEEDKQFFLDNHPFQSYYHGENAYRPEEYRAFAEAAGLSTLKTLAFKDSAINYFPHNKHLIADLDERAVSGRPYTFVLKPSRPNL